MVLVVVFAVKLPGGIQIDKRQCVRSTVEACEEQIAATLAEYRGPVRASICDVSAWDDGKPGERVTGYHRWTIIPNEHGRAWGGGGIRGGGL